jgi:CRP/FNR family transcriptional regulator, cyclic AMP receptor protein
MPTLDSMLRDSLWAQTLNPGELDRVISESHERTVPVGGHSMRCGEPADYWIGVIDGLIKMSISMPDGRHSSFTGVTGGGWAGEGSLLRASRWRYDGVAVRETRLALVPRRSFERLVATNLAFNRFLLAHLNARLSLFIGLCEFERLYGPDARVARCLASLFDPDLYPRTGSFVRLSQEEIGLLAGVSRQRANEALHQLERDGMLRIQFGGVEVLDLPGLRGYCGTKSPSPQRPAAAVRDRALPVRARADLKYAVTGLPSSNGLV